MITFRVPDMSCGHCIATITRAVQSVDPDARLSADLERHEVVVTSARADAPTLQGAIVAAGYDAALLPTAPGPAAA